MTHNFIIQKNNFKDTDNKPDYRIVAKDGEEFVTVGAGWKKQDKAGNAYISCTLSKSFNGKPGYRIASEAPESPQSDDNSGSGGNVPVGDEIDF